jgi:hypothetical protein
MKYRIKVTTFKNGRQLFHAQFKKMFSWVGISYDGEAHWAYNGECDTRERALRRIDKHFEGNATEHSIEFEYINR